MKHVADRKKKVVISLNNLYTSGIINKKMSIPTRMKLFKVYIKPLLTYGVNCSTLIQTNWVNSKNAKVKMLLNK